MTAHSIERATERACLTKEGAVRLIIAASNRGKSAANMPAKERRYMMNKESNGNYSLFYSQYLFIMSSEGKCITMYQVPQWFGKAGGYDGKVKIRNKKQYLRLNPEKGQKQNEYEKEIRIAY